MVFRFTIVLLLTILLSACATTTVQNVWMDDSYTGSVSRVLVLGVTKNKAARQMFEAELARQLEEKGVSAIPSFPLFPSDEAVDKETILKVAKEKKVDSVIVAKVLNVQTYTERVSDVRSMGYGPSYRYSGRYNTYRRPGGWYGDYSSGYATVRSYDYQYYVSHLETALYLLEGETMVWSALTETETDDDIKGSINELVTVLVTQLELDGLI